MRGETLSPRVARCARSCRPLHEQCRLPRGRQVVVEVGDEVVRAAARRPGRPRGCGTGAGRRRRRRARPRCRRTRRARDRLPASAADRARARSRTSRAVGHAAGARLVRPCTASRRGRSSAGACRTRGTGCPTRMSTRSRPEPGAVGQRRALHPRRAARRRRSRRTWAPGRRWPTGSVDLGRRDAGRRRRPPDERQAHQRVGVVRALVEQPEVALELAVVGGEEDVGVVVPAPLARCARSTRPHASSMSSFSTWVSALTSRIWSCGQRRRARSRRAALGVAPAALVPGEPVRAASARGPRAIASGEPGMAGRQVEVAPGDPVAAPTPAGPTGGAGRGSSSSTNQSSSSASESSQAIVRSATQSVWYQLARDRVVLRSRARRCRRRPRR